MKTNHILGATCFTRHGKKMISHQMAGIKGRLSEVELVNIISALNRFKYELDPFYPNLQSSVYDTKIGSSLMNDRNLKLFKYTNPIDIENYLKYGKIKLGTIDSFRFLENLKAKDIAEGFSNVVLNFNGDDNIFPISTGFNSYNLCFTNKSNSDYHQNNFGKGCYEISDVIGFCEHVKTKLNAKRYYIRKVCYSDLKITRTDNLSIRKFLKNLKNGEISELLFDEIIKIAYFPCLFIKPIAFKEEQEVRIVFEMKADVEEVMYLTDSEIIQYLNFI